MNHCALIVALIMLQFVPSLACGHALFHQRPPVPPPGQISGHIYRADTGDPLAQTIIALQDTHAQSPGNTKAERTTLDGEYSFTQIAPGNYFVTAYRRGFVGQTYGLDRPYAQPKLLTLGPGQHLEGIDLWLSPNPDIVAMVDEPLAAAYSPEQRLHLGFGPGRFSTDGGFFAFAVAGITSGDAEQVWIYDMRSQRLVPATEKPGGAALSFRIHDAAWADDGTLYVDAERIIYQVGRRVRWAASMTQTKEITEFPAAVTAAFQRQAASNLSTFQHEGHNDRFILGYERPCHGCAFRLTISRSDGTGAPIVADLERNFLFDSDRSLVLYPRPGLYGTIVILNLQTRQSREIALPVGAEALLDQTRDGTGSLVAYVARSSCQPEDSARGEQEWIEWILPSHARLRREHVRPSHVCFVRIPAVASTTTN
jgi:hypothetical protein